MKKIVYFLCIMLFGFSIKASPLIEVQYQENIYSNRIGNKLFSGKMGYIFLDNEIVYCLDPFELVGKTYYEDQNYLNNMNKDNLKYFELVAYYGYNKTTRNNIYYYMAAQELIWERIIGGDNVYWTTGENGSGDRIDISTYKNEIEKNIERFYRLPSFNGRNLEKSMYEPIYEIDGKNALETYNIYFDGKSEVKKENNMLLIKYLDLEWKEIKFSKKLETEYKTKIYTGKGNQTLGRFGINIENSGSVRIKAKIPYKMNLQINLYDKLTNDKINDYNLKICDENNVEKERTWTNDNGTYTADQKFAIGKYHLCSVPDGYIENENIYFEISNDSMLENTIIDIYLEKPLIEEKKESKINNVIEEKEYLKKDKETAQVIQKDNKEEINSIEEVAFKEELPNTSDYNSNKYKIIFLILILGIYYEVKSIRN